MKLQHSQQTKGQSDELLSYTHLDVLVPPQDVLPGTVGHQRVRVQTVRQTLLNDLQPRCKNDTCIKVRVAPPKETLHHMCRLNKTSGRFKFFPNNEAHEPTIGFCGSGLFSSDASCPDSTALVSASSSCTRHNMPGEIPFPAIHFATSSGSTPANRRVTVCCLDSQATFQSSRERATCSLFSKICNTTNQTRV